MNHEQEHDSRNHKRPEARVLSIREAASVLGIGRSLAYELARQGKLPTIKLGRRVLIPKAALERLLERSVAE